MIAAKVFDGWDDPRTHQVRNWIFNIWAKESKLGWLVSELYILFGEWVAQKPILVKLLKPLIYKALRRANGDRS